MCRRASLEWCAARQEKDERIYVCVCLTIILRARVVHDLILVDCELITTRASGIIVLLHNNQYLFNSRIIIIYSGKLQNNWLRSHRKHFRLEVFRARPGSYTYLKYFFIVINLPLRILTPYLVAYLCFLWLFFKKSHNFRLGRLVKPARHLVVFLHIGYKLRS